MKKRNAFGMIELIFVMIIMAILIAISIPSMKESSDSAKLISAKSDTVNLINQLSQQLSLPNVNFDNLDWLDTSWDSDNDGFLDDGAGNDHLIGGKKVPWSKGNYVEVYGLACNESISDNGFYVATMVKSICSNADCTKSPAMIYNSCIGGKIISTIDWNGN